jgi:hypothetical protein
MGLKGVSFAEYDKFPLYQHINILELVIID